MTAGEMRRKTALMPEGTVLYIYHNGEFLPVDCIRLYRDDEEAVIFPIKGDSVSPKKDAPDKPQK